MWKSAGLVLTPPFYAYMIDLRHTEGCIDNDDRRDREPRMELNVLLVEDNSSVRNVLKLMLEKHGYGVLEASGGMDRAVDLRQAEQIALTLGSRCPYVGCGIART